MAGLEIITLGCRLNVFESEVMRQLGDRAGLENAVIINTCAVTGEAERQARQAIRRARRKNPKATLIVTGCAAQLAPERYGNMPEVDRVLGNKEKLDLATFKVWKLNSRSELVSDIMSEDQVNPHLITGIDGRVRAFVQIQQGCDHRCTFCIIPFARGPNRSVGIGHLVLQVSKLVAKGFKEVVLTGVDICSYGQDSRLRYGLGDMIVELLGAVPDLGRLRLSSLDPAAIDDTLFQLIAEEPRLMPHFHLSLQAMDDMILKRMKRRHTRAKGFSVIERLRKARPDITIGADLIAGFPTETDEMFLNTLNAIKSLNLTHLHVFPYSVRKGTPAAKMPGVPGDIIKARAAILRDAGNQEFQKFCLRQIGSIGEVLIEKPGYGYNKHYVGVEVVCSHKPGSLVNVHIKGVTDGGLWGEII